MTYTKIIDSYNRGQMQLKKKKDGIEEKTF